MDDVKPVSLLGVDPELLRGLSPQLRRAARFVVENPGDIATRSQRHVAEVSNLPAPTFTRLARAVGLESYDGLRDLCRADVLNARPTILADRAQASVTEHNADDAPLIAGHAGAMFRNVQTLLDRIDLIQLAQAAGMLAQANRVVLIGEMSARGLVDYASYVANMSLTGWKVLARPGESLSSELAVLGPQDACIAMSVSPYATRAVETLKYVVDCNVPTIALTDNAMSPLATLAHYNFFIGTNSPNFFPSHVPTLLVLETLVDMVIRERGVQALQHIAAVERQNHKLNEYWRDGPAKPQGDEQ